MKIFWCHEHGEYAGLYVKALSRGRAKVIYADEVGCSFTDVRANIWRHAVNDFFEGVIEPDSPLCEKYGLEYGEEEE